MVAKAIVVRKSLGPKRPCGFDSRPRHEKRPVNPDQRENAFAGENLGHRLETIVAVHLIRKCKMEGRDVYYLNDRSGECDFVVCKGNKVEQCIQVSYDISADKTRKREINGLLLAARQTQCENLLLLTDHESEHIQQDGHIITVQPVYEWSLE